MKQRLPFIRVDLRALSLFLLLLLLVASPDFARSQEQITAVFVPPSGPLLAGNSAALWLYCMNNSSNEIVYAFPPTLNCALTCANLATNAVLSLNDGSEAARVTISSGGFARKEYRFEVPRIEGEARLTISNYNQLVFTVRRDTSTPAITAAPPPNAPPAPPPGGPPQIPHAGPEVMNFLTRHLSTYEPIYFMLGTYPAAEFQFSLKYQIFAFDNDKNWMENGLNHSFFAFTQTSLWDLFSRDPSFYDTSYKPSLFFYYTNIFGATETNFFRLDLQPGTEHESNGRGGTGERSLYTAYIQPTAIFYLPENFALSLQPRARFYYWIGQNNPDIVHYRGYADLLAAVTWYAPAKDGETRDSHERIQLAAKFQIGDTGSHPGLKLDLRFNLAGVHILSAFTPSLQLQYFTGYGQSLRQYNEYSHSFRAGLCLWY